MSNLKNISKKTIVTGILILLLVLATAVIIVINTNKSKNSKYSAKTYENMTENYLADKVKKYITGTIGLEEEMSDTVADAAVRDYNIILNSGVMSITDEHTEALEEDMKKELQQLLINSNIKFEEDDINNLTAGVCKIIWDVLLSELNNSKSELSSEYDEQYVELVSDLQRQIDSLSKRSNSVRITANIKKNEKSSTAENEKMYKDMYNDVYKNVTDNISDNLNNIQDEINRDVYNDVYKNVTDNISDNLNNIQDKIKKDVTENVMKNVKDGKDGTAGKDGKDGKDGVASYTYIRYATDMKGSGMTQTPTDQTYYIGVYSGNSASAPTTPDAYTWSLYRGEDKAIASYDADTNTLVFTIKK